MSFQAYGGPGLTNYIIGTFNEHTTTGNLNVSGLGFQPDHVFLMSACTTTAADGTAISDSQWSFGWLRAGGVDAVLAGAGNSSSGAGTTLCFCDLGRCLTMFNAGATDIDCYASGVSLNSDGFTVNFGARASTRSIYYLAVKGGSWSSGSITTQTDSTPVPVTGSGFLPKGILLGSSQNAFTGLFNTTDVRQLGAASSTSQRTVQQMGDLDNADPTDVITAINHQSIYVTNSFASGIIATMDLSSFDADGFTYLMDDPDTVATREIWYLLVGDSP